MASDTATDLRVERKPKLSEQRRRGDPRAGARRRDPAGPEAADREPADRDLRRQPHRRSARRWPRWPPTAWSNRARAPASSSSSTSRRPSARSASEIGNKISHRAQRARGAPGHRDRKRRPCRDPPQRRAGGARSRRPSSSSSGCCSTASRPARPTSPSTAPSPAATNNPFYVEMLDALGRRAIPCDVTSPWVDRTACCPTSTRRAAARASGHPERHLGRRRRSRARRDARASSASQQRYRERLHGRQADYSDRSGHGPQPGADRR